MSKKPSKAEFLKRRNAIVEYVKASKSLVELLESEEMKRSPEELERMNEKAFEILREHLQEQNEQEVRERASLEAERNRNAKPCTVLPIRLKK